MHLDEENRCRIYETRPLECRVDDMWEKQLSDVITRGRWHALIHRGCNALMQADGRPPAFDVGDP